MALKHPFTVAKVTSLFFDDVLKLYGMPNNIISYRGSTFTSYFWNELFKLQSVTLSYSFAYHPQSDGQIESFNKCLEHFLRCFIGDKRRFWFNWPALVEW